MSETRLPDQLADFIVRAIPAFRKLIGLGFHASPYKGELGEGVDFGRYTVTDNLVGTLDIYLTDQTTSTKCLLTHSCTPKEAVGRIVLHHLNLWEEE